MFWKALLSLLKGPGRARRLKRNRNAATSYGQLLRIQELHSWVTVQLYSLPHKPCLAQTDCLQGGIRKNQKVYHVGVECTLVLWIDWLSLWSISWFVECTYKYHPKRTEPLSTNTWAEDNGKIRGEAKLQSRGLFNWPAIFVCIMASSRSDPRAADEWCRSSNYFDVMICIGVTASGDQMMHLFARGSKRTSRTHTRQVVCISRNEKLQDELEYLFLEKY